MLHITQSPTPLSSAYGPNETVVASDLSPTSQDPTDVVAVSSIFYDDVYGLVAFVGGGAVQPWMRPGQPFTLEGTENGLYDGEWTVTDDPVGGSVQFNGENLGPAIGGTMRRVYRNYVVIAEVTMNGRPPVKYRLLPGSDGFFHLDVSDLAKRTFLDVFDLCDDSAGLLALFSAEGYITQRYTIRFTEGYDVLQDDGTWVFTWFNKGFEVTSQPKAIVNSVREYHHDNEYTEAVDRTWNEDLTPFGVMQLPNTRRWLTHNPGQGGTAVDMDTAQRASLTDPCWIAFLYWGKWHMPWIRVQWWTQGGGTGMANHQITLTGTESSWILNASAAALALPDTTERWCVSMWNPAQDVQDLERIWFVRDDRCETGTRFYALNELGAVDQYTVDGKVSRTNSVDRMQMAKLNRKRKPSIAGDHDRRIWKVDLSKYYSASTRTERKWTARWLMDAILSSVDVRLRKMPDGEQFTPVLIESSDVDAGENSSRFALEWRLGVDETRQRR